jgi:hypothetical protein
MSAQNSKKIVSINATTRERSPGLRIVNESLDQLGDSLCRWLAEIRAPIAEELFLLADSTRERLLQTRYLDLRQDIERDWTQVIEAFRHSFSDSRKKIATSSCSALEVPDFDGLQLVDDEELSERIVVREFAAQLTETCDAELYPLDRRVAALLGHEEPVEGENPLAPIRLCEALTDAIAAAGLDTESRLLLLRRIERHLHQALPSLYHQINAELIERGILPDLKRSYRRSGNTPAPTTESNTAVAALQAAAEAMPAVAGDLLGAMQRLAASRAQSSFGMAAPMTASELANMPINAASISHSFLASLNEAQHVPWQPGVGTMLNQVQQFRESDAAQQVSPLESVTIDIVAMLFDFIFNDDELPASVKSLIGQLQIPVLKVAMLDSSFFGNRQHPARRFLDGITGIALHWGTGNGEDDPFHLRLAAVVSRIQQEFETNVEIFGEAITELEAFVTEQEAEEASTLNVAAEAVSRREMEDSAWERARTAIQPILEKTTNEAVRAFLSEHWSALLQQTALSHESDSPAWQEAQEVAEQLVWSISAKTDGDERLRLISSLPMLLARINAGLNRIGISPEERNAFFDTLVSLHAAALKGTQVKEEARESKTQAIPASSLSQLLTPPATASEGDLLVTRRVEEGILIEEVMLVGAPPMRRARDRNALEQVEELKRGDWVDFIDADGNVARERLNWISPQKGILVFSNHRAAKAISISPDALARQIRDGAAQVVAENSVFDKAFDGVMQSLNVA